jgi:hypothetical protein
MSGILLAAVGLRSGFENHEALDYLLMQEPVIGSGKYIIS